MEYNWNESFLNCPSVVWMVIDDDGDDDGGDGGDDGANTWWARARIIM